MNVEAVKMFPRPWCWRATVHTHDPRLAEAGPALGVPAAVLT
jgi:hypothetical protein